MRELALVAAILPQEVLGTGRDVLVVDTLGAGVQDGYDEVGACRRPPHEALRCGDVRQALCPRVRREADDGHAHAACPKHRDLARPPAPAQPVARECPQSLPLAGGAVVEGVVVRDVEVVEARAA